MTQEPRVRAVIQEMVKRLVRDYTPQQIILFGSYAYGQPTQDSDIDLLIIKDTPEGFWDRMDSVRRVVTGAHPHIPIEPLIYTPDEIVRRLKAKDQFVQGILQNGEVLYAA